MLEINGVKVNYEINGCGEPVVLLHGWGQNIAMMKPVSDALIDQFQVVNLDLPGFGGSSEPTFAWSIYDYADFLSSFLSYLGIEKPIIIGHSFGVRIAIIYASKHETGKLVFTGGAGILPKRGIDYYFKVYTYKTTKKILSLPGLKHFKNKLSSKAGSSDYQQASATMKRVLINVVNEDLSCLLKDIKVPTLLIWGANDDATPLWMAKKMESEIKDAGLVVIENAGHFAYFDNVNYFNVVVKTFIGKDK